VPEVAARSCASVDATYAAHASLKQESVKKSDDADEVFKGLAIHFFHLSADHLAMVWKNVGVTIGPEPQLFYQLWWMIL
jgi:hypothetical protein